MVAARIVHGAKISRRWNDGGNHGRKKGAPPRLPPPLPTTEQLTGTVEGRRSWSSAERVKVGKRGSVVVAVDLLDMETLPGVEVRLQFVVLGGGGLKDTSIPWFTQLSI